MSLLKTVNVKEAQGKVKEVYGEIEGAVGMVPNILQLLSVNPDILEAQWNKVKYISSMEEDSKKLISIMRYLMSVRNKCTYCSALISMMINRNYGITQEELESIQNDLSKAPLSNSNKELLKFTLKAVENPEEIEAEDVKKLEDLGVKQTQIFDTVQEAVHMYSMNMLSRIFKVERDF
ncbi:hypothetical protein [Sulfurimonas sp.]|uniref:carboxymuconolactone decarboxylase family protein n=1 Tax=Sulfurimonas sp. TaxID=2022749 RepID=UPI001A05A908|nr:hypothetical protein [Sulfurimonas sp.]MBE0515542.1 hypothetical protein [Sulfurimonas sp.]